jgi:hypothetical protein
MAIEVEAEINFKTPLRLGTLSYLVILNFWIRWTIGNDLASKSRADYEFSNHLLQLSTNVTWCDLHSQNEHFHCSNEHFMYSCKVAVQSAESNKSTKAI